MKSKSSTLSTPPLRVLHVAETTHGGIRAYWHEIKIIQGIEQDFLAPLDGQQRGWRRSVWLFKALRRKLKTERYDIIHLHSSFAGIVGRLAILTLLRRPKIVYCAHGWAFNMDTAGWKKCIYGLIERVLFIWTDCVVQVSDFEARTAAAYGIKGKKCVTILNGVNDIAPIQAKALDKEKIHLLFVGRFHAAKGVDILLNIAQQAAHSAPHIQFHVVGGAQAVNEREIAFPANTIQYGWLPRADILPLYAACDALIVPSRWDAFSLVAAEAIRASKPLIMNDAAALPEFTDNGAHGFVFDMTISEHISPLLNHLDKQILHAMGKYNRSIYEDLYTAERMNTELLALYQALSSSA